MGFEELPGWWSHEGLGRGARSEKTWKFYALSAYLVLDISSQIIAYCIILYYIVLYCIILYYIVLYSLLYCIIAYWWEVKMLVSQLCPTLCDPMDCSPHPTPPTPRLLCPWNSPSKNTGVSSHSLLQGIFPTQDSNPGLLHYRQIHYHLSHRNQ